MDIIIIIVLIVRIVILFLPYLNTIKLCVHGCLFVLSLGVLLSQCILYFP